MRDTAKNKRGVVAAGHEVTAAAGREILEKGGNAYDAILAAYMTACVAEPVLTSLGGGGYLLAHTVGEKKDVVYDFFVQTPHSKKDVDNPDFKAKTVDFGTTTQDFHIGLGSSAVPGGVRGVLHIHKKLGSLPFSEIIKPAVKAAQKGVVVNTYQSHLFDIITPIFTSTKESLRIYGSKKQKGVLAGEGEIIYNPEYATFLERLAQDGDTFFYEGDIARTIVDAHASNGGYITMKDLASYTVIEREPVEYRYRGHRLISNPPPSSGGVLIAFALGLCEKLQLHTYQGNEQSYYKLLTQIMAATNGARGEVLNDMLFDSNIIKDFLDPVLLSRFANEIEGVTNHMGSTTQISVIDGEGNCASMTTSNGEGSGYIVPGTGVHINNMLGEEDLHPLGFHNWKENERISSMMAPSLLVGPEVGILALGSGGSNRIRTAILQVILHLIDGKKSLDEAVFLPRIHIEKGKVDMESGFSNTLAEVLQSEPGIIDVNEHGSKGVFFGGVHCAAYDKDLEAFGGVGDMRRGGTSIILP